METVIWWIRRDLRLADNQALHAALNDGRRVVPVFILDHKLLNSPYAGRRRSAFLLAGLRSLESSLHERGGRLIVRSGDPRHELAALMGETGATAIFAEADFSPYARRRDERVKADLPLHLTAGLTVQGPETILKADGKPYTVFTPFSRAWKARPLPDRDQLLPSPARIDMPADIISLPIPNDAGTAAISRFPAGETEALQRLEAFTAGEQPPLFAYSQTRNRPDLDSTAQLSPYFRFGLLSARTAVVAALEGIERASNANDRESATAWLNELIWREFFTAILYHFPDVRRRNFRRQFDAIAWENDPDLFEAWSQGRTGYPFVDAAMRQLAEIGWMHNRTRMVVASFLVKHLLIDWRWGEKWFMQHLLDGDPAANNGGWQWAAGTGTDAAPYFRIFNPILQSKKFDPQGVYIRRWLPELARVPDTFIHEPWQMPSAVQRQAGCHIGRDYPGPIIDHAQARERALVAYQQAGTAG